MSDEYFPGREGERVMIGRFFGNGTGFGFNLPPGPGAVIYTDDPKSIIFFQQPENYDSG